MRTSYIGMGANLPGPAGPPEAALAAAAEGLNSIGRVTARSSLYSTTPVGFAGQPRFFNAAVALETELAPRPLLEALLGMERRFGRNRTTAIPNGPRTLDLDILLIEGVVVSEPGLEVPHPRLVERGFALIPLAEIAPQAIDPRTGTTMAQWLKRLFPNLTDALQIVAPIQSDLWRPGLGSAASAGEP